MPEPQIDWPTVSPASFWPPHRLLSSGWIEHAPFASWLVDAMRPGVVVELGTHNGYSIFAMAAAARRVGSPTRLFAIDSWEGDDQAGFYAEDVYASVREEVEREFSDSIELVRSYFADAVDRFADGTVDLLHIDGRHGYDDVMADWELYRPKLSPRGVAIFHDTHEFQEGFGVHRFWQEIGEPTGFTFHHGHGLGVLPVGDDVAPPVREFIAAARSDPSSVRGAYGQLGARWSAQWDREQGLASSVGHLTGVAEQLSRRVHELEVALETDRAELLGVHNQLAETRASSSWRMTAPLRSVSRVLRRHP